MRNKIIEYLRSISSLIMLFLCFVTLANNSFGQVEVSHQAQFDLKLEISKYLFTESQEIPLTQIGFLYRLIDSNTLLASHPNNQFLTNIKPQIEIIERTSYFSRLTYSYEDGPPRNVYGYAGLGYSQDFKNTLSIHSPAFEQAKRNKLWVGLMILGAVTISASSSVLSFTQRNPVSKAAIITFLSGTGIVVVASVGRARTLKESIRIFNIRE